VILSDFIELNRK